ncbi:hypothetical protein C8Q76DRAFT_234242 [Earliella scabrosa]|nr:hypothetical protein C8Q76DRAFT_234242 [Earliella scabrosa]
MKSPHRLFGDDAGDVALESTIKALDAGRGLVGLAGVPGLPEALDVLIGILRKVQDTKSNKEAVKGLCEDVEDLCNVIEGVADTMKQRLDGLPSGSPDRVAVEIALHSARSLDLNTRIDGLKRELDEVLSEAGTLADKSQIARFLRSKQDADAINRMREKINNARQNFQLQGGIAIEVVALETLRVITAESDARILKELSPLDGALYLSEDNSPKSRFLQGTREEIFRNLDLWIEQTSTVGAKHRVLVLIGAAGMGKSTIASEFCRRLSDQNRLGASFFFTRGTQGLNSIRGFFNTISYQLAVSQPDPLHDIIVAAARKHLAKGGASQNMKVACEDLIRAPLRDISALPSHAPIFVVIDALDECTAEEIDTIPNFLSLLLSCAQDASSPLRIFLTSRPESEHVRSILDAHSFVSVHDFRDIGGRILIDQDIKAVITHRLSEHPTTRSWSVMNPTAIDWLVDRSQGIFVYASTAAEFLVGQGDFGTTILDRTLERLLRDDGGAGISLQRLDKLYLTVLETAFPEQTMSPDLRERIPLILGLVAVWRGQIILPWLEALTGIPCDDSRPILHQLRAVIQWDSDASDPGYRIIHTTFRDFLHDTEKRKTIPRPEFHVDAAQAHATLALGCMRLGLYYVGKYMPELLEDSSELETLELCKLNEWSLLDRMEEKLRGKQVDEPWHSVRAVHIYVDSCCAYHRRLSTSVQSVEMIKTAERLDQIPSDVFSAFTRAIFDNSFRSNRLK